MNPAEAKQGGGAQTTTAATPGHAKPFSQSQCRFAPRCACISLFLAGLLGRLGDLASALISLGDGFDDTDGDGLSHVADGKTAQWWVVGEGLDAHGLGWNHLDDGGVTRFDGLWVVFDGLASATVDLLQKLGELAGDVSGVAIEDWGVSSADLAGVVQHDDLSSERVTALGGVILGVGSDVASADFLDRDVLDIEADVVTRETLGKGFVVHLDRLDFGCNTSRGEGDDHAGLDDTSLDTTDRHSPNTADLVNVLKGKTKGLVGGTRRWVDGIDGFEQSLTGDLGLGFLLPSLIPGRVGTRFDHVVTVETRDGDESGMFWVVADLLDESGRLLDDFIVSRLGPFGSVHLVDGDDELSDTEGVGQESVLTSLTVLGDTGFELTSTGSNDENGAVGLGGTSDHVLDEVTVTWSVDDGDIILGGFEFP